MKLMDETIKKTIPPLYSTENQGGEALAVVKFFDPFSQWTWFVMEGEEQENDFLFFGLVFGFEKEFGYFSLNELESIRRIERDSYFKPTKMRDIYPEFYDRS